MRIITLLGAAILLCASSSTLAKSPTHCYVIGDSSDNKLSHPLGSQQNPYALLADVQANPVCESITVLHSGVALDGGITLRDDQRLEGQKGPGGELPIITNSSPANNGGCGVVMARDTRLKRLHIKDTWSAAIAGGFGISAIGGDLTIQDALVTGANTSGTFNPLWSYWAVASISLAPTEDINITLKNSDIGQANVSSVNIFQVDGQGDIQIRNTVVRDQGQLSENFELSPGIAIYGVGSSPLDVAIIDTTVHNIGSEFVSNSDGLLLMNVANGAMTAQVDGYRYSNPDDGGPWGTSSALKWGFGAPTVVAALMGASPTALSRAPGTVAFKSWTAKVPLVAIP